MDRFLSPFVEMEIVLLLLRPTIVSEIQSLWA
jgi:hypothetical protein